MVSLLPSAFHGFDRLFRLGGGVSRSETRSRARLREDFLGLSSGAPSSGELYPAHGERKPGVAERGMDVIPYPSTESPYTEEPTALMASSVR